MISKEWLDAAEKALTQDEKEMLSSIYAPTVVGIPDEDPFGSLTVMPGGVLRYYGEYAKPDIYEAGRPCYQESRDCGLTWQRHFIREEDALGASVYVPFLNTWMCARDAGKKGMEICTASHPDKKIERRVYVACPGMEINDRGEGEPQLLPVVLMHKNRVLIRFHYRKPQVHPTCYYAGLAWSDDGENWHLSHIADAPYHERKWPHKGYRWQQNNREHTIVELDGGRLMMLSRTATDYLYVSYSEDFGETWSTPAPSPFHSTGTMPHLNRLRDGRIVLLWCNTQLLPELASADGMWEDYFTNRDVCHIAVSEDNGKTFIGFRELRINPIATAPDFRSYGGPEAGTDKSMHQFESVELPHNKLLIASGQHPALRRFTILDLRWVYEEKRKETFLHGLENLSTQVYIKSIPNGYRGLPGNPRGDVGHCAYNRTTGAYLLPSPENDGHEALFIRRKDDPILLTGIGGAVWNFPAAKRGRVEIRASVRGQGLRLSLLDTWRNPSDESVAYLADYSTVLLSSMHPAGEVFTTFTVDFDCEDDTVSVSAGDYLFYSGRLRGTHPFGLSYLHLQSAATADDEDGTYLTSLSFEKR